MQVFSQKKDVFILSIGFVQCLVYAIIQQSNFNWHNNIFGFQIDFEELLIQSIGLYIMLIVFAFGIALLSHTDKKGSYFPVFINALKKAGLYAVPCILFLIVFTEVLFSSII